MRHHQFRIHHPKPSRCPQRRPLRESTSCPRDGRCRVQRSRRPCDVAAVPRRDDLGIFLAVGHRRLYGRMRSNAPINPSVWPLAIRCRCLNRAPIQKRPTRLGVGKSHAARANGCLLFPTRRLSAKAAAGQDVPARAGGALLPAASPSAPCRSRSLGSCRRGRRGAGPCSSQSCHGSRRSPPAR